MKPLDLDALERDFADQRYEDGIALIERVRRAEAHRDNAVANLRSALAKEESLLQRAEKLEARLLRAEGSLRKIAGDRSHDA